MAKIQSRIVGDIKINQPENNVEYLEVVMEELATFMEKHQIDKLDVAWSKFGTPKIQCGPND